jgi:Ala-tRNA(Pro) deacylase
MTDQKE